MNNSLPITRVILYVKDVPRVASFYQRFFGLIPLADGDEANDPNTKWLELRSSACGCTIALHKAAASQKSGAAMKLVFGVADVRAFKSAAESQGLRFGVVHAVDGVEFCNAKDPAGNSIQISNRGLS